MLIPSPAGPDKSAVFALIVAAFPSITHILSAAQPAWKALCASCVQLTRRAIKKASLATASGRTVIYLAIATAVLAAGCAL